MITPADRSATLSLTVVGAINLDLVARVDRLPRAGETVEAISYHRMPGGKGANQALGAAKLGAVVRLVGAVGDDQHADDALAELVAGGVELDLERGGNTGVAMILVDRDGENQIVVASEANARITPRPITGAVLCQLEVPDQVVRAAAMEAGYFVLNASPARVVDVVPDLLIVNELEYETVREGELVAVTTGSDGASLIQRGNVVARAKAPRVDVVDGTAAGDAFAACLVVSLLEGRSHADALHRACTAGSLAATKLGAQSSLPTRFELEAFLAGRASA